MNIEITLPPDVIDAIVARVRAEVLEALDRQPDQLSEYVTIPEAADILRCERQRVDDLLSKRKLTRVKEGTRTLIARAEIHAHLQTRRTPP